jgi:hypothetical protein
MEEYLQRFLQLGKPNRAPADDEVDLVALVEDLLPLVEPAADFVARGAPIARMGMTGNATGVHLHYEVWIGDLLVDPLHYGRPPIYVSAPAPEPLPIPDSEFVEPKPTY